MWIQLQEGQHSRCLAKLNPDMCAWQETGLTVNNLIKIKGYHTSLRDRKNFKKMGGVCTAVRNEWKSHTVKINEGENENVYLGSRKLTQALPAALAQVYTYVFL